MKHLIFLLLTYLPLASELITNDTLTIRQLRVAQNEAIVTCDLDKIISFCTNDIVITSGNGTTIIGKEAYLAAFNTALNEKKLLFVRETDSIELSTHLPIAYELGTWTAIHHGIPIITGRYSAQWVKSKEGWLINAELFVTLYCS